MEIFVPGLGSPLRTAVHEEACLNKRLRPQFHGHGESCPIKKKRKKKDGGLYQPRQMGFSDMVTASNPSTNNACTLA